MGSWNERITATSGGDFGIRAMGEEEGDEVWVGNMGVEYSIVGFPTMMHENLEDFWGSGSAYCMRADFSALGQQVF